MSLFGKSEEVDEEIEGIANDLAAILAQSRRADGTNSNEKIAYLQGALDALIARLRRDARI